MPPNAKPVFRAVVAAAVEFHARRLWERFEDTVCFAITMPSEEHPVVAAIMGAAGSEFGLAVYRGEGAMRQWQAAWENDPTAEAYQESLDLIHFSMTPMRDIPPELRRVLRETGYSKPIAPLFLAKEPGQVARELRRREAETMLYAIRAILAADDAGELVALAPPLEPRAQVLTLHASGDPREPEVHVVVETHEAGADEPIEPIPVPDNVRSLEIVDSPWVIGMPVLPHRVRGEDRTLFAVIVLDPSSELVVKCSVIAGFDVAAAAQAVFEAFAGDNMTGWRGLPHVIVFASQALFESIGPALSELGVACGFEPSVTAFDELVEELAGQIVPGAGDPDDDAAELDRLPEPGDLEGWLRADETATRRIVRYAEDNDAVTRRALRRFFGDRADADKLMEIPSVRAAMLAWLLIDYRAKKGRRTLAERYLDGPASQVERELLLGRIESRPSFYRVESIRDETVELVDLVHGHTVTVWDEIIADLSTPDLILAARVRPAGDFRFLDVLGPPLDAQMAERAFSFLDKRGLRLTPEGLAERSHLIGRLWEWMFQEMAKPLMLQNTDGEPLELQVASFTVADPAALEASLAARGDVRAREAGERDWIWVRPNRDGSDTHLARLELIGGRLVVEVNSSQRLARVRQWLEQIAGVAFEASEQRQLDLADIDTGPPGGGPEGEMPPEAREILQEQLRAHYMAWIDEPVLMLQGKTPREVCRTEAGRQKVRRMIRSLPRVGDGTIEPPREEMLRELGL